MSSWLDSIGFRRVTKEKERYLNALASETIFNRVAVKLEAMISAEDGDALQDLFEGGDFDSLSTFLTPRGVNLDNLIDEETGAYVEEMVQAGKILEGIND